MKTKSERIAELNDLCRTAMGVAGRLVQSEGINALPPRDQSVIRQRVELFNNFTRSNDPHGERDFGTFEHKGDILSAALLTEYSPFLNTNQLNYGISDAVYEWLPQQMMSLLTCPTAPRYLVYCYGQTLKPAQDAIVTSSTALAGGGTAFGLVTNYQVVAESAARAVIRMDRHVSATGTNFTTTVESYNPLPPN